MTLGKNDKDLKKQILTNESVENLVSSALHYNKIDCFTILECTGFYTYENGQNVKEKSLRIEICTDIDIDVNLNPDEDELAEVAMNVTDHVEVACECYRPARYSYLCHMFLHYCNVNIS